MKKILKFSMLLILCVIPVILQAQSLETNAIDTHKIAIACFVIGLINGIINWILGMDNPVECLSCSVVGFMIGGFVSLFGSLDSAKPIGPMASNLFLFLIGFILPVMIDFIVFCIRDKEVSSYQT